MPEKLDASSTLYKAAVPHARRSLPRLLAFVGVSVVAAIASAFLLTRYMDRRAALARLPTRPVVVAASDLPVGTALREENLTVVDWPTASLPAGAFEAPKDLEGKMLAARVYAREPVIAAKLAGGAGAGLSALLPPGMRAVAVRVDDVVGVAGFIQPGDSVDVVATIRADGVGQAVTSSKVILQNVRVLAVGKELDTRSRADKVVQATVATLMIDPAQSERLALAAVQGKLLLTLRNDGDTDVVATQGTTALALLNRLEPAAASVPAQRASPPRVARAARIARVEPPPRPAGEVVEILRGDVFEKRKFEGKAP
jgi:pilus assembly protein CpaB